MEGHTILPVAETAHPPTILVIEDEADIANLLAYRLKREGFQAHVARDGGEGCRMIEAVRPDCILLDLLLPVLDGWSVCRAIRGHHDVRLSATPIVMLTALGDLDTRVQGLETDSFSLPLEETIPDRVIEEVLELYRPAAVAKGISTIKSLFYGETSDPRDSVARKVRSAAAEARKAALEQAALYEQIAARLHRTDSDFFGEDITFRLSTRLALLAVWIAPEIKEPLP